jgi:hypothetical protein
MLKNKIQQPFSLLYMIFRFGRLRHSGRDFNRERSVDLQSLSTFVPSKNWFSQLTGFPVTKKFLMKNAYLRTLITQFAFLKNSVTPHGGHLHAPFLGVSYIRIPKSASTSLSGLMLQAIYPDLNNKQLTSKQINYLTDVNLRKSVGAEDHADIFFTVVRNPFARIISVYRDFFGDRANDHIYEDYLFGILPKNLTFHDFVKRVEGIPDMLKDPHLRPQHYFVDFYKRKNPNIVVLQLEKPDEIKSFLFIYNLEIPHLNASEKAYDYTQYYDLESFELVSRMYKQDLKMFGYEQENRSLLNFIKSAEKK